MPRNRGTAKGRNGDGASGPWSEADASGTVECCLTCEADAAGTVEHCLACETDALHNVPPSTFRPFA